MKTIFTYFFLCTINTSFAANINSISPGDSTLKKAFKITREEFLDKYGCDDSSRALINFYFRKRNHPKANFIAGAFLLLIAGIAFFPVNKRFNAKMNSGYNYDDFGYTDPGTMLLVLWVIALESVGVPLLVSGGIMWMQFSRKRLLGLLNNYNNGMSIPHRIAKANVFKGFLRYGRWDSSVKREMRLARLMGINEQKQKIWEEHLNRRLMRRQKM